MDAALSRHPGSADLVRERLDLLGRMGLIGGAPELLLLEACEWIRRPQPQDVTGDGRLDLLFESLGRLGAAAGAPR